MVLIGFLYLALEGFVLSDFSRVKGTDAPANPISRIVTGVQVGLTLLATLVTRSSALALQSNQGLPIGNQIVGWIVLGMCPFFPVNIPAVSIDG